MITSHSNPHVKLVRSLARRHMRHAAKQFVIEGVRLIEDAMRAGVLPTLVFYVARVETDERAHALLEQLRPSTPDTLEVSEDVMREMSTTETPPGILAIVPFVELPLPGSLQFVLILDAVRDPGNIGTILRSARAAGVDVVLFAPGTADPYNDKVVRAAMGAHFAVPLRVLSRWEEIAGAVREIPRIYLADAQGDVPYATADWSHPVALIVGGEAQGASDAAKQIATARVAIPMRGDAESLNAAMAATVLLFQAAQNS